MSRYRLSEQSRSGMDDIWLYIASDNPAATDRFIDELIGKFQILARQPGVGRTRDELAESLRSFPRRKLRYLLLYAARRDRGCARAEWFPRHPQRLRGILALRLLRYGLFRVPRPSCHGLKRLADPAMMGAAMATWRADQSRILIMADGYLDVFQAKTAMGLLRYHADHVVAILNREHAGGDLEAVLGIGSGIPIVGSVAEAKAFKPDSFVIGVATSGGGLPPGWRADVRAALDAGLDVVSGLHERLTDDRELAAASGGRIHDLRHCDESFEIGSGRARNTSARRILTVGSDCNVGKMVVTVELARALQRRGWNAPMVATGQTGIMVCGDGVCVDALVSDFVAGAAEAMVLKHADADAVVVEGQGSLLHPGFSGVTLGLMHGVLPDLMVLVHQPKRKCFRRTDIPIPPLRELIAMHESIMRPLHVSKVAAVALNCHGMDDVAAKREVAETEREIELPVTDCVRFGADLLADAVEW